jgi:ADP-heptose:LPS heptosyltransferase
VHSWIGHGDDNYVARLAMVSGGTVQIHRLRGMKHGEHASDYLARCLGVHPTSISLELAAEAVHWAADFWALHGLGDSTLIIHPGSGSPLKNWQGMATIAERWRTRGHGSVLLLCGPAEQSADVPHDAVAREPSLHRVAALLRRGAGYLGNDSGISHLAGLTGAVGVVTFGPSDPKTWHPLGSGLYVCRAESGTCDRCARTEFCTHVLRVDDVWEALCRQLSASPRGTDSPSSQTDRKQE